MIKKIINTRNLREKVYKSVRDYVLDIGLKQGSKIDEDGLAKGLGVSKTPIREALSKLAIEGLVEIIPNRGSYKTKLSEKDLYEIMLIRESLEGLCARLSAQYIDKKTIERLKKILDEIESGNLAENFIKYPRAHQEFFALIHQASKCSRLIHVIQGMYDLTHLLRLQYFSTPEKVKSSIQRHRRLIDALERKDGESAETLRRHAIRFAYNSMLKELEENDSSDALKR